MTIWIREITKEFLMEKSKNTLLTHVGIEYVDIGDDYLVAKMPVDERTIQPYGILHGGASCVLAESVGSMASNCCVDPETHHCVGLSINTNHISAVKKGFVFGKAVPIHLGQSTQVWEINIHSESDRLVSVTRLTMAVLKRKNYLASK